MDQLTRINGSHVLLSVVATTSITDGDGPGVPIVPTRRRHIVEQEEREDTRRGRPSRFATAGLGQDQPPNSARGIAPSLAAQVSPASLPLNVLRKRVTRRNFRSATSDLQLCGGDDLWRPLVSLRGPISASLFGIAAGRGSSGFGRDDFFFFLRNPETPEHASVPHTPSPSSPAGSIDRRRGRSEAERSWRAARVANRYYCGRDYYPLLLPPRRSPSVTTGPPPRKLPHVSSRLSLATLAVASGGQRRTRYL